MKVKARVIAFYLPQFHPIPENDRFWGEGFTEWTNVRRAKPLFRGHHQPHVPADLGYYDLRSAEVRRRQAELAREAGVEGFCYWHYWFGGGKQLLQEIFDAVVDSGEPDFPFCVGWANHSWTAKNWANTRSLSKDHIIAEQTYPGEEDHIAHFYSLLKAFRDPRYITVDGKLLFYVFSPLSLPDPEGFIKLWNGLARKEGLPGFHFVGLSENGKLELERGRARLFKGAELLFPQVFARGFDAVNSRGVYLAQYRYHAGWFSMLKALLHRYALKFLDTTPLMKYDYRKVSRLVFDSKEDARENVYPTIIPNWDRSPRAGKRAFIWYNYKPAYFREQVREAVRLVSGKSEQHRILFLMSWNEWGEGNYVEPDQEFGHGYLDALREALTEE